MNATGPIRGAPPPADSRPPGAPAPPPETPEAAEAAASFSRLVDGKKSGTGGGGGSGGIAGDEAAPGEGGPASEKGMVASDRSGRPGRPGSGPGPGGEPAGLAGRPEGTVKKDEKPGGLSELFGQANRSLTGGPVDPAALAPTNVPAAPPPSAAPVGAPSPSAASEATTQARCGELVERILVAQPAADGTQEVRLKLDRQWLPDTEVRLVRSDAGLAVEFASDDVNAQRFLLPNLSALRERLAERLDGAVTVRMSEQAPSGGDPGDGRSRNRRNLFEEMENGGER